MRNKIQLYIEGLPADLDDGAFLLLNYTAEDLSNPTIVKNSFSRQITLKGTARNDAIFGHIYRNDRVTVYGSPYTGTHFDPTRRTAFTIYNDLGEILESGYLKLDEVVTNRKRHEYKVTLYGGLGSFLYGLSYDSQGNKLTLADLDFGQTLDFTINRATVASAWARLGGDSSQSAKWDIINFMPCYTGFPGKEFNADKAVFRPADVGLPTTDESGRYTTNDGWVLCQLSEKVTGNEAKDFRSYLQKPVLRLQSVINAICNSSNNGGWTVNLDPEISSGPIADYWSRGWITLPMLDKLNIDFSGTSGPATVTSLSNITIPDGGVVATKYDLAIHINPLCSETGNDLVLYCEDDWAAGMQGDESPGYYLNWLEVSVVVSRNGGPAKVYYFCFSTHQAPGGQAPTMDQVADLINGGRFSNGGFDIQVSDYGVTSISVSIAQRGVAWGHLRGSADPSLVFPDWSSDVNDGIAATWSLSPSDVTVYVNGISSSTVRTGATITKAALLSGEHTPADYLLSFCKTFGLNIVCNTAEKEVNILLRKNLYTGTVVDISGRIDRGKDISKTPFAFDARWYVWKNEYKGDFADYYANKYGMALGTFRVNTGYDFDASEQVMTDSVLFNGLASVQETSKYYCDLVDPNIGAVPSLFLGGGKYSLYRAGGETIDIDLPRFDTASKTWYSYYPMHDDWPKVQVHGKENANIDERDTLVFFNGMHVPSSTKLSLTDDTIQMVTLNGNAPCWQPFYCVYDSGARIDFMPQFTRYMYSYGNITKSMDWGDPVELLMPGTNVNANSNIFEQFWEKYISDRYDDDSAVVTCYVDLRGMKVDESMLRKFYAFDGAIWALNRIIDYSLTTSGPTKCEFVKVQDKSNYTSL